MKNLFSPSMIRRLMSMAFMCTLLFLTNCSGILSTLDSYSGETLYESAVESDGDILGFVPDIQSDVYKYLKTEKQKRVFEKFQKDFITQLVQENPGFAKEFYDKMHSNDRQKINQALTEAGELLEKELQELTGESNISAENVVKVVLKKENVY